MVHYNIFRGAATTGTGWWTPKRIRTAGVAGILGSLLLYVYFIVTTAFELSGARPWEAVGSLGYYASETWLMIAWACVFAGFAGLYVRIARTGGRILKAGSLLAAVGAAMATLGFLVATVTPAVGALDIVDPANLVIGLGLMIGIPVGLFLLGIGVLRSHLLSRGLGLLLVLTVPATLLAGVVGTALGLGAVTTLVVILPLCMAIALLGNYLRTETPDAMSTTVTA